jgi:hypothetical protein
LKQALDLQILDIYKLDKQMQRIEFAQNILSQEGIELSGKDLIYDILLEF